VVVVVELKNWIDLKMNFDYLEVKWIGLENFFNENCGGGGGNTDCFLLKVPILDTSAMVDSPFFMVGR